MQLSDDSDEFDVPSEWEEDWDDSTDVIACSNCGSEVYADAEQCPLCGEYLIRSSRVWDGKPVWWVALGLAGILAVIMVLSGM